MGVKDLWSTIEPVRESVPLYSLSGKTLAVDLSLWVCEAQHVQAMMGRVTKPHLRNLFFRVSSLTLMGVKLVFVMEGEAPKLKAETMNKRTETRYGGFNKAPAAKATTNTSRGRFNAVLRECAEMLDYMGVPWVTAAGEAEAMCAYLDSQGLVDGCITNDGDAFLYGAQTVYRNFNMNSKDPQVECYKTSRIETELKLSREDLVGLAILLGCDYIPKGISGVGKEQALRLIQMLKGQTLLQRFIQWKEERTEVCERVVKKVAHCHICRHPGSAKAHERGGCLLCNSKHFCQPQDFDYECPCDWHRYEQARQASSLEANIRKKTLASQQFPFTEIIQEFLISKDKPVSHFKRRQPNMLLMQKFAFRKMEWPKHYTSEKVLVLMTYAELMNRKYGRESSQIRPLRIFKARVRNSVACYEIIWSTPEHFVFPEDRPADDQHEVRTVEEESLFSVAFPELVEKYLKDKAEAEENKTKKRKPRSKQEKAPAASDGISDLLAQMTLQSAPPQTPEEPEVLVLDTPVKNDPHQKSTDDHSNPTAAASPSVPAVIDALHLSDINWDATSFTSSPAPVSHADPAVAASPSVPAVIDALHLSDINWDATSFTSSPSPQSAANCKRESELRETADEDVKERENTTSDGLRFTECPLRERLLMRNAAKELAPLKLIPSLNSEPNRQISCKDVKLSQKPERESDLYKKEPLTASNRAKTNSDSSKVSLISSAQTQIKTKHIPQKPPQKYKFVKKAISSSLVPNQRSQSDPGHGDRDKNLPETTKKSVCTRVCSSSEDSDAENHKSGPQRKSRNKTESRSLSEVPPKPFPGSKPSKTTHKQSLIPKPKSCSADTEVQSIKSDIFSPAPASPAALLEESDDSVICNDSPLPLAERLRLKFLK
ncbi:flap endonuclease GEN homolog 1 [Halichoeres trimaculatus]|uniref:flap endonuclease GEN homolog 1 n=1 Tax=Halichoeres trimaculatus TaxID=147232 RepID=UPI003D9EE6F1